MTTGNDKFRGPPVLWPGMREPWRGPNFTPPLPGRPVNPNNTNFDQSATQPPIPNDGVEAVREDFRFAHINNITLIAPFVTPAPNQPGSILFLSQPNTKRNFLGLRNLMNAGILYIDFGQPASQNSLIAVQPGQLIIFDSVVPQDDLWASFDQVGGGTFTYGYSNYKAD